MAAAPRVEMLWWAGCPSWEQAAHLVREEMEAAGLDPAALELREIATGEAAARETFVGSPTIRVEGRDIQDPGDQPSGLTCRVYRLRDGRISPLPDRADVREALREAARERCRGASTGRKAAMSAGPPLEGALLKSSCAAAYAHPAVRWLLGGELHPGGAETTRRALELAGLRPGERLLDVASGAGDSALLAARDLGGRVVGVEYGADAVSDARAAASKAGLDRRVEFLVGDAEALPVEDEAFDVVLCECSLCTFPDKARAMAEMRRVLRPGGRLALTDVVAEEERLPAQLRGGLATIACVGAALPTDGYELLLAEAGFEGVRVEARGEDAARLAERVSDRLRGARLLGLGSPAALPLPLEQAIATVAAAREAIADGTLGYAIFSAERP